MLKVTRIVSRNGHNGYVLKVEGQGTGRSVDELRRVCRELLEQNGAAAHPLVLDLEGLSYLDAAGVTLFGELSARNVSFTNCSAFITELLKEVADGGC